MSQPKHSVVAFHFFVASLVVAEASFGFFQSSADEAPVVPTAKFPQNAVLTDRQINESSGLILSQRNQGCLWTHNDSGDSARLFLVHRDGRTIARLNLQGVEAIDWEDIAYAMIDGTPKIIVGDIGGNSSKRKFVSLHLLTEPIFPFDEINPMDPIESSAKVEVTLNVSFKGGVTDYEAIAVDHAARTILIFEKAILGGRVFSVPLPGPPKLAKEQIDIQAQQIGFANIPIVCACDISSDSKSLVVTNYKFGYLFSRRTISAGLLEDWSDTLKRGPTLFVLPKMRQPEAVCFSKDSKSIFMTSEQRPTPLLEITLPKARE